MNNANHSEVFAQNVTKNGFVINECVNELSVSMMLKGCIHGSIVKNISESDIDRDSMVQLSDDMVDSIIQKRFYRTVEYDDCEFFSKAFDNEDMSTIMNPVSNDQETFSSGDYVVYWKFTVENGFLYIIMKISEKYHKDQYYVPVTISLTNGFVDGDTTRFWVKNWKPLYNVFLESQGMSKHIKCDEIIEDEHKLTLRNHSGSGPAEYNVAYASIFGWSVTTL